MVHRDARLLAGTPCSLKRLWAERSCSFQFTLSSGRVTRLPKRFVELLIGQTSGINRLCKRFGGFGESQRCGEFFIQNRLHEDFNPHAGRGSALLQEAFSVWIERNRDRHALMIPRFSPLTHGFSTQAAGDDRRSRSYSFVLGLRALLIPDIMDLM